MIEERIGKVQIRIKPQVDGLESIVGSMHYVTEIFDSRYNIRVKGMAYGEEESLTSVIDKYIEARIKLNKCKEANKNGKNKL